MIDEKKRQAVDKNSNQFFDDWWVQRSAEAVLQILSGQSVNLRRPIKLSSTLARHCLRSWQMATLQRQFAAVMVAIARIAAERWPCVCASSGCEEWTRPVSKRCRIHAPCIKVLIRHQDHRQRVHCCCVTGDRNLNCAVYRPTVGNVADDDTNKYIYYTLYETHSFLLILLDLTLSALSLYSRHTTAMHTRPMIVMTD